MQYRTLSRDFTCQFQIICAAYVCTYTGLYLENSSKGGKTEVPRNKGGGGGGKYGNEGV